MTPHQVADLLTLILFGGGWCIQFLHIRWLRRNHDRLWKLHLQLIEYNIGVAMGELAESQSGKQPRGEA